MSLLDNTNQAVKIAVQELSMESDLVDSRRYKETMHCGNNRLTFGCFNNGKRPRKQEQQSRLSIITGTDSMFH